MRILVAGSLKDVPRDSELCQEFAEAMGREIAKQDHILLNGCRGSLDGQLAGAANQWLESNGKDPARFIIGYCNKGSEPEHRFGAIRRSSLSDWNMNHAELKVPEQIEGADVTIFVAGHEGTYWAKNWAFYARKPILGIPRFGGAGETIYEQELGRLQAESPSIAEDYEKLNDVSKDVSTYVRDVIALSQRLVSPRSVFAIMSFSDEYRDVYESYKEVCKEFDFEAERTDDSTSLERIVPRVEKGIKKSAFVIADVSEWSPNVFYEVGFARGVGKNVILTARKGKKRAFDIADIPSIEWNHQAELKEGLRKCIAGIKGKYGRF